MRILVCDTGRGIPPDMTEAIFEEFMQLSNPARNRHLGLGLGLAVVERLSGPAGSQDRGKLDPGAGQYLRGGGASGDGGRGVTGVRGRRAGGEGARSIGNTPLDLLPSPMTFSSP